MKVSAVLFIEYGIAELLLLCLVLTFSGIYVA